MANPTFFIKRNDTAPSLDAALEDDKNRPVDITGATTVFHMRDTSDNSVKIASGVVSVLSAVRGEVRYTWAASDTDTAGNFEAEFQVTFADSTIESFPNDSYIAVIINEDVS